MIIESLILVVLFAIGCRIFYVVGYTSYKFDKHTILYFKYLGIEEFLEQCEPNEFVEDTLEDVIRLKKESLNAMKLPVKALK